MFKIPFFFTRLATAAYLYLPIIVSHVLPGLVSSRMSVVCIGLVGKRFSVDSRISKGLFHATLVTALLLLAGTNAGAQKVTGAIFTTDMNGAFVNGNVYNEMEAVYLNGGPRPNVNSCGAPGLPDGFYYFQVTDPSGKDLLSLDPIGNREVQVTSGLITAYVTDGVSIPHLTSVGLCGDVTVALFPYMATTNNGGEYKVWMTSVDNYDSTETLGSYGFISSKSKTDNFKVLTPDTGIGTDSDGDGVPDDLDVCPGIPDDSSDCNPVS